MAMDIIMPQMGESVAEGTIVRWLKKVGDAVERDEPIFEITTDKVDAEIPSPEAGVILEIRVLAGTTVEVGAVVGRLGAAGEATASAPAAAPASAPAAAPASAPAAAPAAAAPAPAPAPVVEKPRAEMTAAELRQTRSTPVVRAIAEEHGVDLRDVTGTGLDGRVTRKDIEAFIASGAKPAAKAAPAVAAVAAPAAPAAAKPAGKVDLGTVPKVAVHAGASDRVEAMTPMRRTISDRMIQSKQYSAHVHTCFEVDYGRVEVLRKKHKEAYAARGVKLTYTAFLAKAAVDALRAYPIVNSSHDGESVTYRGDINLGIAVALDWGLLVPVVKNADEKSLLGLGKSINDLGERARNKKLQPDDVSGLTFSITNPGIFGSQWGTPIIPQPTVAILGVGTIEKRVKVVTLPDGTDTIGIKLCGYLTLGFDHRVIDGAVADQFMGHIKRSLENFDESAM